MKLSIFILIMTIMTSHLIPLRSKAEAREQFELKEVAVTSDLAKSSTPLFQAPGNLIKLEQETIRDRATPSLSPVLQYEPNITFVGGPRPHAELPNIRGLNSDRILILDEGVRQNFQSGHLGRIFSDFTIMEKVEVLKGPWSALYGSGAIGGVIRFERSTAKDMMNRYGPTKFSEVHFLADTNSQLKSIRATGFAKKGRFSPLVSVRSGNNQNILLSDGERLRYSAAQDQDIYGSFGFEMDSNQNLNLKINRYQQSTEVPNNPTQAETLGSRLSATELIKNDLVLDYQFTPNQAFEFKFKAYQRETEVTQRRLSDSRLESRNVTTQGLDTWANYKAQLSDNIATTQTFGFEIFQDTNLGQSSQTNTIASFPNANSEEFGIYWQPDFRFNNKLSVTPGIRYDNFDRNPTSGPNHTKNSGSRLTRRLYSNYNLDDSNTSSIFAGWGEGFRSPRIQDIYAFGLHFPGLPANPINQCSPPRCPDNMFISNPYLRPETAQTIEFGFKKLWQTDKKDRSYLAQLTFFNTEAQDFIFQDVRLQTGQTQFVNLDRVRLRGYEASLKSTYKKWLTIISYGETKSLNLNLNEPLADTPANQLNLSVQYLWTDQIRVGADSRFVEAQNLIPSPANNASRVTTTPEYNIVDLYVSYQNYHYGNWLLRGSNVGGTDFRPHGSFVNGPGQNLNLSWTQSY